MALMRRVGFRQEGLHIKSLWFKEEWADDAVFAMLETEWKTIRRTADAGRRIHLSSDAPPST